MTTDTGRHFVVHAVIEVEVRRLQLFKTLCSQCRVCVEHLGAVLLLLKEVYYGRRMVKFSIDPADGEIVVFADMAILDSVPTPTQVLGLIAFVMERLRECAERVETTVRTGEDPGEEDIIGGEEPPADEEPGPDDVIS